jgi:hypothetical protein
MLELVYFHISPKKYDAYLASSVPKIIFLYSRNYLKNEKIYVQRIKHKNSCGVCAPQTLENRGSENPELELCS